jgi:hypothetical protein
MQQRIERLLQQRQLLHVQLKFSRAQLLTSFAMRRCCFIRVLKQLWHKQLNPCPCSRCYGVENLQLSSSIVGVGRGKRYEGVTRHLLCGPGFGAFELTVI